MTPADLAQMAEDGALWCPAAYCAGGLKQPLHQTEHDATLYRCSCCGTDWTLDALAVEYGALAAPREPFTFTGEFVPDDADMDVSVPLCPQCCAAIRAALAGAGRVS